MSITDTQQQGFTVIALCAETKLIRMSYIEFAHNPWCAIKAVAENKDNGLLDFVCVLPGEVTEETQGVYLPGEFALDSDEVMAIVEAERKKDGLGTEMPENVDFTNNMASVSVTPEQFEAIKKTFECFESSAVKREAILDATGFGADEAEADLVAILGDDVADYCVGAYCIFYVD